MKDVSSNELLFKLIFASRKEPMALLNRQGAILEVNTAFEQSTRCTGERLKRRRLAAVCCLANEPEERPPLMQRWEGEVHWRFPEDQAIPLRIVLEALYDSTGEIGGFLVRVEEKILVPAAAALEPEQLSRQQKLESLGVLASSVAHDLNNILTGVLGHVSYLRLSLPPSLSHRDSILAIEDGARRAASITQQILEFARGKEVELATANLSLIVAAALNLMRGSFPSTVKLHFQSGQEDIFVHGDESQLSQLVINLAVNAKEALLEGGEIRLRLSKTVLHGPSATKLGLAPGEYALLVVKDNGQGIAPEVRERIFEPFFTTKSAHGTGLGLATVYSIVKAHRGTIEVDSVVEQGSSFEVYLHLSSEEQYRNRPQQDETLPTGNEKILVVDDEEAVRTVIQRSLEHLGYKVVIAGSAKEALGYFQSEAESFSLVIIDMIMPHMPGDELFHKLQEIDKNVAVLIASGYSSDGRTKAILDKGALGYIQKPFAVEELAQEVRRCLDSGKTRP